MVQGTRVSIEIAPQAYLVAAATLLFIPLRWISAWVVAAAVHECFHIFALMICKKKIFGLQVGMAGAIIHAEEMKTGECLFCSLAGPCGALLLLLIAPLFPRMAVCAFVQSVFNLIPVLPLDGGHALQCILQMVFTESITQAILQWITRVVILILILLIALSAVFLKNGMTPGVFAVCLLLKLVRIKIPCKTMSHRVQ